MINLENKLDEKKMFREASLVDYLIQKISPTESIDMLKDMAKDNDFNFDFSPLSSYIK
jgi:hypothetical protein